MAAASGRKTTDDDEKLKRIEADRLEINSAYDNVRDD